MVWGGGWLAPEDPLKKVLEDRSPAAGVPGAEGSVPIAVVAKPGALPSVEPSSPATALAVVVLEELASTGLLVPSVTLLSVPNKLVEAAAASLSVVVVEVASVSLAAVVPMSVTVDVVASVVLTVVPPPVVGVSLPEEKLSWVVPAVVMVAALVAVLDGREETKVVVKVPLEVKGGEVAVVVPVALREEEELAVLLALDEVLLALLVNEDEEVLAVTLVSVTVVAVVDELFVVVVLLVVLELVLVVIVLVVLDTLVLVVLVLAVVVVVVLVTISAQAMLCPAHNALLLDPIFPTLPGGIFFATPLQDAWL